MCIETDLVAKASDQAVLQVELSSDYEYGYATGSPSQPDLA